MCPNQEIIKGNLTLDNLLVQTQLRSLRAFLSSCMKLLHTGTNKTNKTEKRQIKRKKYNEFVHLHNLPLKEMNKLKYIVIHVWYS